MNSSARGGEGGGIDCIWLTILIDVRQAQGFRADAVQYNAVLGALMESGSLPAQLKALQLFQVALRQGILRCARRMLPRFGMLS